MTLVVHDVVLPLAEFDLEISLTLERGSTALYGPSGAGKTSLLELIAGLRKPQRGRIAIDDRVLCDDGVFVPPRHRRIGYVPQDDALFPHLSVRENVLYGAKDRELDSIVEVLEIGSLLDRGIRQLSGGERKRVALARALMTRPQLLLLDEPLSGVDLSLRDRVLVYLARVRAELAVPTVYVTHHLDEAEAICDEIVLLDRGRVIEHRAL